MEDEKIIELFFNRSEQAITELDAKYGKFCRRLSNNILNNIQDTEECLNDTYLALWNAIPPERPNPLLTYLCKTVRNLSLKLYHRKTAAKRNSAYDAVLEELEDCLSSPDTVESEAEAKELTRLIEGYLDTLSQENRVIFIRRCWFSDPYSEIAKQTGLTEKTVSVRLTRLRKQLKQYLKEKGVII